MLLFYVLLSFWSVFRDAVLSLSTSPLELQISKLSFYIGICFRVYAFIEVDTVPNDVVYVESDSGDRFMTRGLFKRDSSYISEIHLEDE